MHDVFHDAHLLMCSLNIKCLSTQVAWGIFIFMPFGLLWIFSWSFNSSDCLKTFPQVSHVNSSFQLVCIGPVFSYYSHWSFPLWDFWYWGFFEFFSSSITLVWTFVGVNCLMFPQIFCWHKEFTTDITFERFSIWILGFEIEANVLSHVLQW